MTPAPLAAELADLRAEAAHLRRVNQELLATVAELRATVEKQQARIDRLVRLTFGRRSERVTESVPAADNSVPDTSPTPLTPHASSPPSDRASPRRRGHGRRPLPTDLPRERV